MKKSSNISVTALHRFIPQPASGRSSALPCLDCIFSMVRILVIIAFTRFDFQNPLLISALLYVNLKMALRRLCEVPFALFLHISLNKIFFQAFARDPEIAFVDHYRIQLVLFYHFINSRLADFKTAGSLFHCEQFVFIHFHSPLHRSCQTDCTSLAAMQLLYPIWG